jgi:hypothetical protein
MRTVTFNTQVHEGVIRIPERYKSLESRNIEVILVVKNPEADGKKGTKGISKPSRTAKGILGKYKNPALISKEKTAWEIGKW